MALQKKNIFVRFGRAFLPMTVGALIVLGLFEGYIVYRLTHPSRTADEITPKHFQVLTGSGLAWSEEQWPNPDGTLSVGWLLRGAAGAPAIVLNHGYGRNRSELLSLGVKLGEAGYHVLLPDLRGHGASPVSYTSLGEYERRDLLSAIEFLKAKRDSQGQLITDASRIGVYGVSLGGYAAVTAAAEDPAIHVVVADAVYPTPDNLTQALLKEIFVTNPQVLAKIAGVGLRGYLLGRYNDISAGEAVTKYRDKKLWLLTTNGTGDEASRATLELFQGATCAKEMVRVDRSRGERLEGPEQDAYDDRIVNIFRKDLPRDSK